MKRIVYPILGMLPLLAQAQTEPALIRQPDSPLTAITPVVTVMGDRFPIDARYSGKNVIQIPAELIKSLPVTTADELLRYIPGVEVQARGPMGSQGDIIMRGSTFSQVLVMVDGVRINDALTGHFNGNIPVSLQEIDYVEVVKGAAATIYGPDAVGGVINFVTRRHSRLSNGVSVGGQVLLGEYNYSGTHIGFNASDSRQLISGGFQLNRTDGQPLSYGGRGYYNNRTVSGAYSRSLGSSWRLTLRSGYDFRNFNARYFYTRSTADRAVEETSNWLNMASTDYVSGRKRIRIDAAYKRSTDEFVFTPTTPANSHVTEMYLLQASGQWRWNNQFTLGYGTQNEYRVIRSSDRGNHEDIHLGLYGMVNYKPKAINLNVNATLRTDYQNFYGLQLSPQVNAAWLITRKFSIRASGGKAVRAPDYTEMYVGNNLPGPIRVGTNWGNPDLKPEIAWNGELGADFVITPGVRLAGTGFYRQGSNIIDFVLTNSNDIPNNQKLVPNSTYFYSQNFTDVQTLGAELELVTRRQIGQVTLQGTAGFTYVENSVPSGTVLTGKYILSQARQLISGGWRVESKWGNFNFTGLYKLRNPDAATVINAELKPSYLVFNASADVNIYQRRLFATAQVYNIFNEQYADILGAAMPGRWAMFGLKFNISR